VITPKTILRLRELAEKANIEQAWFTSIEVEDSDLASVHEDNEFIAACDPATILELLDTLEEYRAALELIADNDQADGKPFAIARAALKGNE
jgi:hypothetical protein